MIDENVQYYDLGIHFWDQDGHIIGTLRCDKEGVLYFSGYMDESARLFLELLNDQGFQMGQVRNENRTEPETPTPKTPISPKDGSREGPLCTSCSTPATPTGELWECLKCHRLVPNKSREGAESL